MSNQGFEKTKQSLEIFVKKTGRIYLTPVEIETGGWLAGASHVTIRELMRDNKIPAIKVGTAFRAHYSDIVAYLKKSYAQGQL
jgi:excisionase family DNA binding protein